MSTDKTLADVQPGGRVRLGDGLRSELLDQAERLERMAAQDRETGESIEQALEAGEEYTPDDAPDVAAGLQHDANRSEEIAALLRKAAAALSAQPSPGGQGDARELLAAEFDKNEVTAAAARRLRNHNETAVEAAALRVIAARQPVGEPVALGETDPIPCAWSDEDASSLVTLRDALRRIIAGTTTKDAAHFLKQPGQRRMTIKDAQEVAVAHLPYVESLVHRSQGYAAPSAQSFPKCVICGKFDVFDTGDVCAPCAHQQPAQAVDLGQFRVAVYCMQKYTGVLPRKYWDKGSKAFDEEAARLMTVIDGAEVARG